MVLYLLFAVGRKVRCGKELINYLKIYTYQVGGTAADVLDATSGIDIKYFGLLTS